MTGGTRGALTAAPPMPRCHSLTCLPPAAPAADEPWPGPDGAPPELDATPPACSELSSVADISSHLCESFLLSPERALECEEPVRSVYRSLGLAVDSLLDMVLDSARQVNRSGF